MKFGVVALSFIALTVSGCGGADETGASDCKRIYDGNQKLCDCYTKMIDAQLPDDDKTLFRTALAAASDKDDFINNVSKAQMSLSSSTAIIGAGKTCAQLHADG